MGKPRKQGIKRFYVPNAKADRRYRPKLHDKRCGITERQQDAAADRRQRRALRELEQMKKREGEQI